MRRAPPTFREPDGTSRICIAARPEPNSGRAGSHSLLGSALRARCGRLLALCTVLGAGLLALGDALAVEHASNNMVSDARQVADPAASDQDDRVFLQVVSLAADVGGDLFMIREPDASHLAEGGIRLLGGHRLDLK